MSFIFQNCKIELLLNKVAHNWTLLTDYEYKEVIKNWKESFEFAFLHGYPEYYGYEKVDSYEIIELLESKIRGDTYIFNIPNYKHLDGTLTHSSFTYGYLTSSMKKIDSFLLNNEGAILCDVNFKFMFLFNDTSEFIPQLYLKKQ